MISESAILHDDYEDEVFSLLKELNNVGANSNKGKALKAEINSVLNKKKYISFPGHYTRYHLTRIGTSYLHDVPLYKRGYLSDFRGKRIRIICLDSGKFTFGYRAGIVYDSPQEKIIHKRPKPNRTYNFPVFLDSHEIIYRSPRYRVIKVDPTIKILCKHTSAGYVETSGWDSVLFDGKAGEPVLTLRLDSDGTIHAKGLYDWCQTSTHTSLRDAIDHVARR